MHILVTGATGYIGSVVVERLLAAGHQVTGLARSRASALRLRQVGASVAEGDLADTTRLGAIAAQHEGVIHAGFDHGDWNAMDAAFAQDEAATNAMLGSLAGSGRPFVYTSGSGVLRETGVVAVDEEAELSTSPMLASRIRVEQTVVAAASRGVRGVVIRAGLVYGAGGGGTMGLLMSLARREGGPFTIGEGWNVWSAVHRDDLAELYVQALERAPAGSLFHAASGDRVSMREIAAAGARAVGRFGPVRTIPVDEARGLAGAMADALAADKRISAHRAREVLGWLPRAPPLVEEIERGSYAPASVAPDLVASTGPVSPGLTMINAFEVPVTATEQFVSEWLTDLAFMQQQPGFVSGTLYRADTDEARFRYINVAYWRQREDFEAAQASIQRRFQTEKIDRRGGWRAVGITMNAATFHADKTF